MSKRAKLITVLSVLAVLVIAALLYFVPRSTPVELSFHVVKLDKNGSDLGTAEVAIRGKKLDYLFQDSRLDVEIAAFDGMVVYLLDGENGNVLKTTEINGHKVMRLTTAVYFVQYDETSWMDITFTEEMDCFAFYQYRDKVYYVGSASGSYDTRGVLNYFNAIAPNIAPER